MDAAVSLDQHFVPANIFFEPFPVLNQPPVQIVEKVMEPPRKKAAKVVNQQDAEIDRLKKVVEQQEDTIDKWKQDYMRQLILGVVDRASTKIPVQPKVDEAKFQQIISHLEKKIQVMKQQFVI